MVVNEVVSERFWKQIIWLSCRTSLVRNVIVQTHHHHNWEATNYARKPHETSKETSSQVLVFKASNWSSNRLEKTANPVVSKLSHAEFNHSGYAILAANLKAMVHSR